MYTVQRETFEGENFRKFQGFVATHQSFLCKFWGCSVCWRHKQAIHDSFLRTNHIFHHFTRVFSLESFQYLQNILLKAATLLVQYCVTMAMAHDDLWLDFCTIKPILIWPLNFPPQRSDFGLVILDDLHRLVEYVQVGGQITVSHALLHALTTLLTTTPLAGVCVRVCVRVCVCVCVRVCACVRTCVSRGIHAEQERLIHPSPCRHQVAGCGDNGRDWQCRAWGTLSFGAARAVHTTTLSPPPGHQECHYLHLRQKHTQVAAHHGTMQWNPSSKSASVIKPQVAQNVLQ